MQKQSFLSNGAGEGLLARLVGPGATSAEIGLQFSAAALAATAVIAAALVQEWGWSPFQIALVALLAFDIAGGIATNATASGKRWYHRPGRSKADHLKFLAVHGLHLGVVGAVFFPMATEMALLGYAYIMVAGVLQLAAPLYLRRPVAVIEASLGILLSIYWIQAPPHLEWLLPGMFLKLLVCYLPYEAPLPDTSRSRSEGRPLRPATPS